MRRADIKVGEAYVDSYGGTFVAVSHGWSVSPGSGWNRRGRFTRKGNPVLVVRRIASYANASTMLPEVTEWARRTGAELDEVPEGTTLSYGDQPVAPTGWDLTSMGLSAFKQTLADYDVARERAAVARREHEVLERAREMLREEDQKTILAGLDLLGIKGPRRRVEVTTGGADWPEKIVVKMDKNTVARLLAMAIDLSMVAGTALAEENADDAT